MRCLRIFFYAWGCQTVFIFYRVIFAERPLSLSYFPLLVWQCIAITIIIFLQAALLWFTHLVWVIGPWWIHRQTMGQRFLLTWDYALEKHLKTYQNHPGTKSSSVSTQCLHFQRNKNIFHQKNVFFLWSQVQHPLTGVTCSVYINVQRYWEENSQTVITFHSLITFIHILHKVFSSISEKLQHNAAFV